MTVCYLEVDDEITGAIARLRAVRDGEAIMVVPPGSRIATSRINFKLLAREGNERRLNLVAVSDDPQVRALAIAAGLPAYDSLPNAEKALASFREQDRQLAERLGREPKKTAAAVAGQMALEEAESTRVMPVPAPSTAPATSTSAGARPTAAHSASETGQRQRRRRVGWAPLAGAAVLLLLLAGVGYGAYLFLPTANITLRPATTALAPAPFTGVADPDVAVSDVEAGVVPAQRLEIPVSVTGQFPATGIDTRETRATGTVRFRSENTVGAVPVIEGTIVATANGTQFETTQAATVPVADFATSTPGTVDVPVRAVRAGPRGNVEANDITEVPANLRSQLVSVRNPDPTDGGRRIEEQVVQQSDWDAAVDSLQDQLESALAAKLNDPQTTPRGLTLFFESAQTGSEDIEQPQDGVIGSATETFELTMTSIATVTAVNEALVDELGEARVRAGLGADQQLVGDVVDVSHSAGEVIGETVAYEVSPSADVFAEPETATLKDAVRGKSIPEAESILSPYGMVEIAMWPEFVDRLPDQTARISLVVVTPSARP